MKLKRYAEQLLNLYNYVDGIMVANTRGEIEYFVTFRPDINHLKESEVLGRHILDIYPNLSEEDSSLLKVLKTGRPIFNQQQNLFTYKGQGINAINNTLPIQDGDRIVGAVDVSRYVDPGFEKQGISLALKKETLKSTLYTLDDIVTKSCTMEVIKERAAMVADTDSSVLIAGDTGTGKELIAQSIHTSSRRKGQKFISQNCAAIPSNLLESILFGTVKGSYTGAENRPGLFELARGGTLFLDEINSMEMSVQPKLLKAIEEKQVTRVGGLAPIPIDVKIVSAVNENPMDCVRTGKLREDLFFRLGVVQITVPSLKERSGDLFLLTSHFISQFNQKMNRSIIGIDEEVEEIFRRYSWPGNVRELKNVIEGAFNITHSRFIKRRDLPEYLLNSLSFKNVGGGTHISLKALKTTGFPSVLQSKSMRKISFAEPWRSQKTWWKQPGSWGFPNRHFTTKSENIS